MNNNDILRRIRYTFDYNDAKMIELFDLGNHKVNRAEISNWLKKEDEADYQVLNDQMLAVFLNGLIVENRGKREGPEAIAERVLNNNIILKKLKIALNLRTDDIVNMFRAIDKQISEHELSALLRNPKQDKYRECNDQYFRHFLNAIQKKFRE